MKNDDSSIKYLIKFVSKRDYAESLLDGNLFMHTAHYYHELEKKMDLGKVTYEKEMSSPGSQYTRIQISPSFVCMPSPKFRMV